jgi:serine/threonine-protein kinase
MFHPERLGRYLLVRKLATGGMAEIFLAKLLGVAGFEKEIVIKKILPQWSSDHDFTSMLIDEAKISVQLNQPNITQVYELAREGDHYYIAMEYLHGVDLRRMMQKVISQKKKVPLEVSLLIATEMLEGLAYAHSRKDSAGNPLKIVHRDISPQNILVSYDGAVKITDFGIAKAASKSHETIAGTLKGKFAYMSPEQANQEPLDGRSDLFAAAIILYELLTRDRLFYKGSDLDTLDRVRKGQVTFSEEAEKSIPPRLKEILLKALSRNPEDRYPDAAVFREELLKFARRSKKTLRREKIAEFLSSLFASEKEEEKVKDEETKAGATKLISQLTTLMPEEDSLTRSLPPEKTEKEIFVLALPKTQKSSEPFWIRYPKQIIIGSLISLAVVALVVLFQKPSEVVSIVPPKPPEKIGASPPEVEPEGPSVAERQAMPGEVALLHPSAPAPEAPKGASKTPPPPKLKDETGTLNIQSIPWGYASVDGAARKETPIRSLSLKTGKHTIKLYYEAEGVTLSSTFEVQASQETVCVADLSKKKEIRCGN